MLFNEGGPNCASHPIRVFCAKVGRKIWMMTHFSIAQSHFRLWYNLFGGGKVEFGDPSLL